VWGQATQRSCWVLDGDGQRSTSASSFGTGGIQYSGRPPVLMTFGLATSKALLASRSVPSSTTEVGFRVCAVPVRATADQPIPARGVEASSVRFTPDQRV
jgi:hypothetical protein